jgi:hypothetical protein
MSSLSLRLMAEPGRRILDTSVVIDHDVIDPEALPDESAIAAITLAGSNHPSFPAPSNGTSQFQVHQPSILEAHLVQALSPLVVTQPHCSSQRRAAVILCI